MKKTISFLAAVIISAAAFIIPASAYSAGIDDRAGLYSQSEIERLEERQAEVAELTGWNIAVVTTDTGFGTDGARAMAYAEQYYDDIFGSDSSSVVYLIDLDYRHFAMDGDLLNYFNTSRLDKLIDECEKKYFNYDDVGNLEKFYYYLEYYYNRGTVAYDGNVGAKGKDFVPSMGVDKEFDFEVFAAAVFTGIVAAAIGAAIVVSRYKFHHAPAPNCYLNGNSINMYNRRDVFVREYTTRTRINSDSSSGGRSGGGGHSHGGSSHGGGGHGGRR